MNYQPQLLDTQQDALPLPFINLARRVRQIISSGDGKHIFEIIAYSGRLLLIVGEGEIEDLGDFNDETDK